MARYGKQQNNNCLLYFQNFNHNLQVIYTMYHLCTKNASILNTNRMESDQVKNVQLIVSKCNLLWKEES